MAMDSMYETMMSLPVFKGISRVQLSDFVAKTPLHFTSFNSGDVVEEFDSPCNTVKSLVSGSIRVTHLLLGGKADVGSTLPAPAVLGIQNLFGLHTRTMFSATSIGQCGIMEFEKGKYLDLLHANNICLLNVLNYLSWRSQRGENFLQEISSLDAPHRMALLVLSVTESTASDILLTAREGSLFSLLGATDADRKTFADMERQGVIKILSESRMEIISRGILCNYWQNY